MNYNNYSMMPNNYDSATAAAKRSVNRLKQDQQAVEKEVDESRANAYNNNQAAMQAVKSANSSSGGAMSKAGSGLLTYGLMGGGAGGAGAAGAVGTAAAMNPYVLGGGAGLMALGAISDAKAEEDKARYDEEVNRLNREQLAISQMANIASNYRSL